MVTLGNVPPENISTPGEQQQQHTMEKKDLSNHKKSKYELSREERIKENQERMQKLGILDLSRKLNALNPTPKRSYQRKPPLTQSPLSRSGPVRRSSRLQNSTPVSYCEVRLTEKEKSLNGEDFLREEGSKPEFYTEEHEKLLGNSEKNWTLFVDGYGKEGKRIYDPVKGKTCHQCRQKTLGHRTSCSKCNMVQGQFCGDCLYMRYGENVLEANENSNWICPVCRGICNCSLCRQAKGWAPTGMLYRKISSLGYKSVAHYLIQTRRLDTDSDKNGVPISAKRSLPFSDIEETKKEDLSKSSGEYINPDPISQSDKEICDGILAPENSRQLKNQVELPLEPETETNAAGYEETITKAESLVDRKTEVKGKQGKIAIDPLNDHPLLTESIECIKSSISESLEKADDSEIKEDFFENERNAKPTKKRAVESTPRKVYATRSGQSCKLADMDSIASRLKMRRRA